MGGGGGCFLVQLQFRRNPNPNRGRRLLVGHFHVATIVE